VETYQFTARASRNVESIILQGKHDYRMEQASGDDKSEFTERHGNLVEAVNEMVLAYLARGRQSYMRPTPPLFPYPFAK
jgi:hypothetical protein